MTLTGAAKGVGTEVVATRFRVAFPGFPARMT